MTRCKYLPVSSAAASLRLTVMQKTSGSDAPFPKCIGILNAYLAYLPIGRTSISV